MTPTTVTSSVDAMGAASEQHPLTQIGLSPADAQGRLREFGPNEIRRDARRMLQSAPSQIVWWTSE